jgi:hypothetical protein
MGLPVFIAATTQTNIAQSNTPTNVPVPAGAQVGDLLIALIIPPQNAVSDIVLPDGWSVIVRNPANLFRDSLIVAAGIHTGGTTYPVACPTTYPKLRTLCYRDVAQTPITASAIKLVTGTNPNTTTSLAVSVANSLELVIACNLEQQNVSVASAAGTTSRIDSATFVSLNAADSAVSVGSSPVRTITQANNTSRAIANLIIAGTGGEDPPPPVDVPVAFTGTVPNQSATVGTPFSLNVASYFSGSLTPFTYSQLGDALTGTGLSFSGSTISGTPTAAAVLSKQVRATDTGSNQATTNTFTITIAAAPPPPATGTPAKDIPSTGTDGPALLYKDIALIGAQPNDLMRAVITVPPTVGTLTMNANSSFTYTGPSTTFQYEGFINDVSYGTGTVTLTTTG